MVRCILFSSMAESTGLEPVHHICDERISNPLQYQIMLSFPRQSFLVIDVAFIRKRYPVVNIRSQSRGILTYVYTNREDMYVAHRYFDDSFYLFLT